MLDAFKTTVHQTLMRRMEGTTGADLSGADRAQMVKKCCGCGNMASCEDWLEDHAEGASKAPSFCANSDVMQRPEG